MSGKKKTTQAVENPVVKAIRIAATALEEAQSIAQLDDLCPKAIADRLDNLFHAVCRTKESTEKRMASAAKKAVKAEKAEATKGERKQKLLDKIAALQKKADAIS